MSTEFSDDAVATDSTHNPADEYARALQTAADALLSIQSLQPRTVACRDGALRSILDAQLMQQKETLVMVLEWLRQQDAVLDAHMRAYFFQRAPDAEDAQSVAPAAVPEDVPAPVAVPAPITTPAKGMPLTLPNQRIRG